MLANRMMMAATSKGTAPGQEAYGTAGTYSFTVPAGVTSISAVCVGAGGGGGGSEYNASQAGSGGGGGGLAYVNDIATTPGESLTVIVGAGGTIGVANNQSGTGGLSNVKRGATVLVEASGGGGGGFGGSGGAGGIPNVGTGGNGLG